MGIFGQGLRRLGSYSEDKFKLSAYIALAVDFFKPCKYLILPKLGKPAPQSAAAVISGYSVCIEAFAKLSYVINLLSTE